MSARYFADYVKEFKRAGALTLDTPALVCHDDGQDVAPQGNSDTAMGVEPNRSLWYEALPPKPGEARLGQGPAMSDPRWSPRSSRPSTQTPSTRTPSTRTPSTQTPSSSLEQDPLRLVFPIIKRPGTAFDHISIGRTENMDVVLPLLQVSKFHAYFTREAAGAFTLADAGSKNGTWIGTRRLSVRTPEPVQHGDRIRLGMYTFTFLTQHGFLELVKSRSVHWVESPTRPSEATARR